MKQYVSETLLLDYNSPKIQAIISERNWRDMTPRDKILNIYNFVRDEILFGFNLRDNLPASYILKNGYGQCNTKGILLMALLRAVKIPCRLHGFTVDKTLQKGILKKSSYFFAPKLLLHSWVEVYYNDRWFNLEGFIIDTKYLNSLQFKFQDCYGKFCGYGVATDNFKYPNITWNENDTYIQKEAIVGDLGLFQSPDKLFSFQRQSLGPIKRKIYENIVRHFMNRRIKKIRENPKHYKK